MAKARRRSNGEGSIFKLPNGKWRVQIELPPTDGKRRRVVRHRKNHADAMRCLAKLKNETPQQATIRITLRNHLAAWLERNTKWKRATRAQHELNIRKHINPTLGGYFIDELTPAQVDAWSVDGKCGKRTKQLSFDTLRLAMEWAENMEKIRRNPCDKVERPASQREEIKPFEPQEVEAIINATQGHRFHAAVVLGFACGMRQGEMFGLPWSGVDLKAGKLKITQQLTDVNGILEIGRPKTEAGIRTITLPQMAVDALVGHQAIMLREGNAGSEYVFPSRLGKFTRRTLFAFRFWNPLLDRLKIDRRGAHHLRHTYATFALGAGVPLHVVSQILGHSKPTTTLDLYAKALPGQQAEAAKVMQKLLA